MTPAKDQPLQSSGALRLLILEFMANHFDVVFVRIAANTLRSPKRIEFHELPQRHKQSSVSPNNLDVSARSNYLLH